MKHDVANIQTDPKSLQGHQLLQRSTIALGSHCPTRSLLLPRTKSATLLPPDSEGDTNPTSQVLLTTTTGALAVLCPLSELLYRRLSTLAHHLTSVLAHPCGLNPREYRLADGAPDAIGGSRAVVDGSLVLRWGELSSIKRAEVASKAGLEVDEVREVLGELMGGLGYL